MAKKTFDAVASMRSIRESLSREMVGKSYEEQRRILDEYLKQAGLQAKFEQESIGSRK